MVEAPTAASSTYQPEDAYDLVRRPVPPAIARWVSGIVHFRELIPGPYRMVETASLDYPLLIGFASPFAIALGREPDPAETYQSFVSGIFAGPAIIHSSGAAHCVQINFTHTGARRFFGLPMSELSGRMVRPDEIGDPWIAWLRERLGELPDAQARLDWVAAALAARLLRSEVADPVAEAAVSLIAARRGAVSIGRLAAHLGCSRKHLAERFRDAVGVPPKTLARIMRFNKAQDMARGGEDWAGIAAACGYADQAHLAREFAELAGQTPTAWRAAA